MTQYSLRSAQNSYPINRLGLRVGRAQENQIILSDPRISALHSVVWLEDDRVYVRDLESTNGTFVNGGRITQVQQLKGGDSIRVGNTDLSVVRRENREAGGGKPWLAMLVAVGFVVVLGLVFWQISNSSRAIPFPPADIGRTVIPHNRLERAQFATVQVLGSTGSGSGSVVDSRGYILTNYHVVEGESRLSIAINMSGQAVPIVAYVAEVVDWNSGLDLALLRIVADGNGQQLRSSPSLTSVPIGNSDHVQLGDEIDILGFPDVGGDTLTLTKGTVAGFHEDGTGRVRGWIKTDAEIGPGNSGGMAINQTGELIAVPTWVSSEERTLGRIGVLRPINLARQLLRRIP